MSFEEQADSHNRPCQREENIMYSGHFHMIALRLVCKGFQYLFDSGQVIRVSQAACILTADFADHSAAIYAQLHHAFAELAFGKVEREIGVFPAYVPFLQHGAPRQKHLVDGLGFFEMFSLVIGA